MLMSVPSFIRLLLVIVLLGLATPAVAQSSAIPTAPDPTASGPYSVDNVEYKLPARRDVLIAPFTVTKLWARLYRPANATGARPLIVMLHGNHATCGRFDPAVLGRVDDDSTYTDTGQCPEGYVVVPSHDGYAYLANQLASWGYYVVSINANRGINGAGGDEEDYGLNLRRGRLILRHLMELDRWNTTSAGTKILGFNLRGKLDFSQIGLFGHSRGGEGVRAALNQYRDIGSIWPSQFRNKPIFRAVFELAPVDGQTSRVLNADGVAWTVLLPACDGDVSDLEGQRVYDRMVTARGETQPAAKSMFAVEGANHNFYNTEWQQSDSQGCYSLDPKQPVVFDPAAAGSPAQQLTALYPVAAFFRAHLGSDPVAAFSQVLDPASRLPGKLARVTRFRRTYSDNVARRGAIVLDDFVRPIGGGEAGIGNQSVALSYVAQTNLAEHDIAAKFGVLAWDSTVLKTTGGTPFYQANAAAPGSGLTIDAYSTLDFRIGLACKGYNQEFIYSCEADPTLNPSNTTDFSIALVSPDGLMTQPVALSRYARPLPPVGLGYGPIVILNRELSPAAAILPGNEPPPGPSGNGHPVLQSVRIPLADFALPKGTKVRGVRLMFNRAAIGAIYLGNVQISRQLDPSGDKGPGPIPIPFAAAPVSAAQTTDTIIAAPTSAARLISGGQVTGIVREMRTIVTAEQATKSAKRAAAPAAPTPGEVIIMAITVPEPIVIGGSLLTLRIGEQAFRLGQAISVPKKGIKEARFTLMPDAFASLTDGTTMTLENGAQRFDLGKLDKALLR